ncbi:hypothetical protein [Brasilonema octagenarum]|uniref:hypothetical protein n=1 Tax=Brasilonema octagenarum TaxID=417105 RepID=UPI001B7CF17B|nr:hypothetical protein [Brasilonema octagenarum]
MKKIVALFKNIRPIKLITVFVAGMILFITQACSSVAATSPRQTVGEQSAPPNSETYVPKGANVNSGYEGGMNNFSDLDPRTSDGKFKAEAEALKENAEQNIQNSSSNAAENIRRVGEDTGKVGRNIQKETGKITEKLQSEAENFAEGTKRGIENIKENTSDAAQGTAKTVQRSAENTKISAQRAAEDAGNAVDKKLTDAKTTADEKTQEAAQNTGNILEKAGNAIKDAVN